MNNNQKLEALKAFLTKNRIEFQENYYSKNCKAEIDLLVVPNMIGVHLSDENDQMFFEKTKKSIHPFFIREEESVEFIIEKMQNCIIKDMQYKQKKLNGQRIEEANRKRHDEKLMKKAGADKPKRKRVRIPMAERVVPKKKSEV